MKIGICDDEQLIAENLKKMIIDCLQEIGQEAEIFWFESGKLLLEKVQDLNAVFLDVKMDEMDGYETGEQIRDLNPYCMIIMATGDREEFHKAFEINALRYISKPFEREKVKEALCELYKQLAEQQTIDLYRDRVLYKVKMKDIRYIESYDGYTIYHTKEFEYREDISLTKAEEILPDMFFRINKQYVVNLRYVKMTADKRVYINGMELSLSRRRKTDFERAYIGYCQ